MMETESGLGRNSIPRSFMTTSLALTNPSHISDKQAWRGIPSSLWDVSTFVDYVSKNN